jgi:phage terminase large subunit
MDSKREIFIDWWPQPRQLTALKACGLSLPFDGEPLHKAVADIIGYGGSAGGGKTDTLLQIAIVAAINYPGINIAYFRREYPNLEGLGGAIPRSKEMIGHFAKYDKQQHRYTFPNGSKLQFCHCKDLGDELSYKSQQFDILLVDEITEFFPEQINFLITRNRATVDYDTFRPFTACGTNPGGIGHTWFKEGFVEIGSPEKVHTYLTETGQPETHYYVPAKLADNQILEERDPRYRQLLSRTELSRKLYLEGDWDIFQGQAFNELRRDIHIVDPFPIPREWNMFGSFDWGYNHPFVFGLFAVDGDGNVYLTARASDRLKRPDEIAKTIVATCGGNMDRVSYIVAGTDCWNPRKERTEPSIFELFSRHEPKILLRQAATDRIQGANQVRDYIAWKGKELDEEGNLRDGKPKFYIFSNAVQSYNTLASMIFDEKKPEDVLKVDADDMGKGGDDDYDMVRYGLMSRPRKTVFSKPQPKSNSFEGFLKKKKEQREIIQESYGY